MAERGALATLDCDDALAKMSAGMLSKQIAEEWDVRPKTLRDKLKRYNPEAYAQAIEEQTHSIVEEATVYALECADKDDAPIARVRLDGAYRYAGAKNPAVYGAKQTVDINVTIDLGDSLRRARERIATTGSIAAPHSAGIIDVTPESERK